MKSPQEFYAQYNDQVIDYDGAYGAQCVDAWRVFCTWIGVPSLPTPNNYADGYWYSKNALGYAQYFEYITDASHLKDGDWCFWARGSSHKSSHVAMYFREQEFGQNQGSHRQFLLKSTTWDILGALRWKDWNTNNDNYKSGGGEVIEKGNDLEQINAQGTAVSTRKIATAFIVYTKNGKKPTMHLKKIESDNTLVYAVQIKLDADTVLCTSYAQDTEWLCKMQSEWMLNNGWHEVACINAGYFEMSGNVGKPVGAVLKDWEGKWSDWYGSDCVPGAGNGYPTLCWDDTIMTLVDQNADKFNLRKYRWLQGVGQSLVIDGKVNCNVGNTNGRYSTSNYASAIGWNQKTGVLSLVANVKTPTGGTMTTLERAYIMHDLGCRLAVQLDGGGSTQLEWLESELSTDDPETPDEPVSGDKDKLIETLTAENKKLSGIISSIKTILKGVE